MGTIRCKAMSIIKTPAIVVLGMHRSGTSLAMSVVEALGIACGDALIPAGPGNLAGFWEHSEIVRIHERLLASLGRVWHSPTGTYPLPTDWLDSVPAREATAALVDVIKSEFDAAAPAVWGFKDPRTARLLPLWQRVFETAGAAPIFLLTIRHPVAVCASLERHNGVDLARGQLLWLQHNLDAVTQAGDDLRLILDFDNLIADPRREVERIAGALGAVLAASEEAKARASKRVSEHLRSHDKSGIVVPNSFVREAYERLASAACDETDLSSLANIAERYREAEMLFQPWQSGSRSTLGDWAVRALLARKYRRT